MTHWTLSSSFWRGWSGWVATLLAAAGGMEARRPCIETTLRNGRIKIFGDRQFGPQTGTGVIDSNRSGTPGEAARPSC